MYIRILITKCALENDVNDPAFNRLMEIDHDVDKAIIGAALVFFETEK